jgi:hypothetical protein
MVTQDERLAAIADAAAAVLRRTAYHAVRAEDVAAAVRLSGESGRSAVWLYNQVRNRRVLVALAAASGWRSFAASSGWSPPAGRIRSVIAARVTLTGALTVVVAFHRAERALVTQVGHGIGDISTAEKRQLSEGGVLTAPDWPDTPLGQVAAAAWDGRCGVFADFLAPVLRQCAEAVTSAADDVLADGAARLSDIAFRTCLADPGGPADLIARGLAALWFERDLARLAGSLPRELESAETALGAVARRGTDIRAEANATAVIVRILLEAGALHERCAREASSAVSLWQRVPARCRSDNERLSDAASYLGLAASRYGDMAAAARAWRLSRDVAGADLGGDASRVARADSNLAELAAVTGHGQRAWDAIAGVHATRRAIAGAAPAGDAAWRRLTITERARADIARQAGRAAQSVRLAAAMLADRLDRLGDAANPEVADAHLALAQSLLAAGHPLAARRHLEEAAGVRAGLFLPSSYRVWEDRVWLAKAALALRRPHDATALLARDTEWFTERTSFRLGHTARRLLAVAAAAAGDTEAAASALAADATRLRELALAPDDPLIADFERSAGEVYLMSGDAGQAVAVLGALASAESAGDPTPARGWTLVLLARAAAGAGDRELAERCFRAVIQLADAGVDAAHPVILTARYDEGNRRLEAGDASQAAELLGPVISRAPLAHGRPALEDGHPLLASAQALAERLGIVPGPPGVRPRPDPAALDAF